MPTAYHNTTIKVFSDMEGTVMAYTPEDSWTEFESTGSITAYLAYREKSNKLPDSAEETCKSQGEDSENK